MQVKQNSRKIFSDHTDGINILKIERNLPQINNIYLISEKIKVRYFKPLGYKEKPWHERAGFFQTETS